MKKNSLADDLTYRNCHGFRTIQGQNKTCAHAIYCKRTMATVVAKTEIFGAVDSLDLDPFFKTQPMMIVPI